METEIKRHSCPICETEIVYNSRYPKCVCSNCMRKAVTADGRPLSFFNTHLGGGFIAYYSGTQEIYDSHICYIEGVKCRADEQYLGGIVIETMFAKDRKDQIAGGIIGLLVGDALGVPYEFHDPISIPKYDEIEYEPPAYFRRSHAGVPVGTYSDDGAQALCLMASLIECRKFEADDFADRLVRWFREDYLAVDKMFDVGIQTQRAILNLRKGFPPLTAGPSDEKNNGNGSLMRVLPLALWHQGSDLELIADAFDQSAVTHGHLRSKLCCALYCLWARRILQNTENAWENAVETIYEIFPAGTIENTELETQISPKDKIYETNGSGYVVDSLRVARWANGNKTYEETVKAAISLGNDTDTSACIAGGIAGLKFGVNSIPTRWRENLRGKELYEPLLERLLERT